MSAAWRRFEVTRLALAQREHLCGVLAGRGIDARSVVVADDENLDIASEFGCETVEQSNDELGRKFNDGIEYAGREGADYVVLIGSDDWVHEDLFDRLPAFQTELPLPTPERPVVIGRPGPEALTGTEIALVDLAGGRMRRCRATGPFGVIPWVLPRTALERCWFRPVREQQYKGIDSSFARGLGVRPEWVFTDPHDLCRVDFKSSVNLNSYEAIVGAIGYGAEERDPWPLLAERYPSYLVEMAQRTSDSMRLEAVA